MLKTYSPRKRGCQMVRFLFMRTRRQSFFVISLIAIALAISIVPAGASKAPAPEEHLIIVGGEIDYPPYSFLNEKGEPAGFSVELARSIAKTMGINAEIRLTAWSEARKALEDGKTDIILGMFYSEERAKIYDFSPPYSMVSSTIFARINSPTVKSIEDLRNKEIIVMRGEVMHDYILKHRMTDRLLLTETPADALRLLASGKGDYALVAQMPGYYWIRELKLSNITSVGPSLEPFKNCFVVRKGNTLLLSRFTEGINILNQTGEYRNLYEKWLGVLEPTRITPGLIIRYAAIVIVPLILLLVISFLWSWMLRSKVNQKTKELQKEEEALKKSHQTFLTVLDGIDATIYAADMDTYEILFMNKCMIDAFGTDSTGRKCHEVFRKESSPCGHCTNDQLLDADGNPNSVCIWETKNPVTGKWYINYDRSIQWVDGRMVRLQIATDITERKQAEEKLQESETRYKSFIAHSTEGIYRIEIVPPVPIDLSPTDIVEWINKNAVVAEVNESLSSMYGLRPDDMVGKHATDFAPDYGKRAAKILEISNYRIVNEVTLDIDNTGNPLWLMENYHGEVHDRHLARIWGVQRNITDRKRIESQRDQQLHFTKALNEITETIISKDNSEDILESTNRIIGKTLQLDRALIYHVAFEKNCIIGLCEWLGQDHPDIALTKNEYPLNMFLSPFTEIKKTKNFLVSHSSEVNEHFIEDGSGKILHEQMNIKSLIWYPFAFDEHGYYVFALNQILKNRQWTKEEISFLESAAKQISIALIKIKILKEKGHLVATLRESEELFRVSMEKAPDGVYMNDLDGNFLYGNRKAEEIIGYRREELIGRNFLDFNMIAEASLGKASELLKANIEGKSTGPDDLEMIRKDGRRILIEITTNVIQREGQTNVLAFVRDITERRQIEDETRLLEERLQRAEKMESLGLLAGGVAHDLNNVLGIVVGYSEMLVDEMDKSHPMREDLKKILEGGNRSAAIVQDLLTLARRGVQNKKTVNMNAIIKDCQNTPEFEKVFAYNQHVKLKMDLESDLLNIMGSSVHLGKTLINLVSNAVEAMHDGGVLKISTTNQYLDMPIHGYDNVREGDYVVLTVSDTGEGILERDIKRIFEPFYTKKIMGRSGTGLGLAVVWGTIKDHNGYINVESTEGKGTIFTLYFPVTREDMESEQISVSMSEYMGRGETILVVDDINRQRELASRMLTKLNYSVNTVASGEEAIEYIKANKTDLIVLDMIMEPGIDGLETYANILKLNHVQKAVIVSGFSESDRVKEAQRIGAGAYVQKPYVLERLGIAVRKELDRK